MIKNRLKHKAAGILAAFLITVSMAGTVWADPLPEETTPPEETTATEPSETTPEETQPVEPQETVIPEETGEPTEYGFGLTPTGNMALQDDITGEEAEAQSIEFLTVTTRDNHTFYIVIEHTKNGDNVHFLNQVDDADLRAVLSDEQVAEYFPDEAGPEPTESSGFSLLGGEEKDPEADTEEGADKESKGGSSMTMLLVVVGLVAAVAGGYYFLKIKPFDEVMDDIADVLQTQAPEHMKNMSWLLDYDQAKDHLFIRVSNAEKNEELISKAPHKMVDDLVITCHIAVDQGPNGMASTLVNNDLMEHFGISEETLFKDAMEKAPEVMPVKIDSMYNVISGMMPEVMADDMLPDAPAPGMTEMMIVTNQAMVNGASALFYPGVMDDISEKMGGNFVMLPSSTNEVIIVPDRGDYQMLEHMVKDINSGCVDPKEQLSDHVYHYDSKEKLFERTDKFEARKAEKDKVPAKKSLLSDLKEKKAQVDDMKKHAPAPAKAKKAEQAL